MITVELPGKPMGKERVRFRIATGTTFTPERTLSYEARLAHAGQLVMAGRELLVGQLEIDLQIYMPIPASRPKKWKAQALAGVIRPNTKPDFDNIAKILGDGLNLVVWRDDCEIVGARIDKWYSDRPRVVLRVWEAKLQGVFG